MSPAAFTARYHKWCKRHGCSFSQSRAVEIHTQARDLIAMLPKDTLTKTMIRRAIDVLDAVSASLERLKTESVRTSKSGPSELRKALFLGTDLYSLT